MNSSDWIALFGVIGGLIAFMTGIFQYYRAQKWKRAEFVAKEIKEFESRPAINKTMQMLDWNARDFVVSTGERESDVKNVLINDNILCSALVPHNKKTGVYTVEEVFVRDNFDQFLDCLERFEHFIQSELINHNEFRPYLFYWIEIIGNKNSNRKPSEFYEKLWDYINFYGYFGVQKLIQRFGYDIHPSSD